MPSAKFDLLAGVFDKKSDLFGVPCKPEIPNEPEPTGFVAELEIWAGFRARTSVRQHFLPQSPLRNLAATLRVTTAFLLGSAVVGWGVDRGNVHAEY